MLLIPHSATMPVQLCSHDLHSHFLWGMIESMQEILANTDDPLMPLFEQQFYELSLLDPEPDAASVFRVRQTHVRWNDQAADLVEGQVDWEEFATLGEAREGYERRRRALVESGFCYSDLPF